jgi:hypothetical protein
MSIRFASISLLFCTSIAAFANPTSCTVSVFSSAPSCQSNLGCPFALRTGLVGTGSFTGQVSYSWGDQTCTASTPGDLFRCEFPISTVGPHQITANFTGTNGAANVNCSTSFTTGKRRSDFQFPTGQTVYTVGMPNFQTNVSVQGATEGQLELFSSGGVVASGPMGANGTSTLTANSSFFSLFLGIPSASIRLLNDPNSQIGITGEGPVTFSQLPPPIGTALIWTPQRLTSALEYRSDQRLLVGNLDLQLPATTFAPVSAMFSFSVDGVAVMADSVDVAGQRRSYRLGFEQFLIGRRSVLFVYNTVIPTAVLENSAQLEVNTGGFE